MTAKKTRKPSVKWTLESVAKAAADFTTRSSFNRALPGAYG